jgi:hypothetical protein
LAIEGSIFVTTDLTNPKSALARDGFDVIAAVGVFYHIVDDRSRSVFDRPSRVFEIISVIGVWRLRAAV